MPAGLTSILRGTGGTHLPQALLCHGTEAQDLTDDGHPLQDIVGCCGGKGVSRDVCVHKRANVQACLRTGQDSQVSRGSRAAICSGLQELERSWTSVSMFSLTSFCNGRGPHSSGNAVLVLSAPAWPSLASPRGRQGAGMVPRVELPALVLQHPVLAP